MTREEIEQILDNQMEYNNTTNIIPYGRVHDTIIDAMVETYNAAIDDCKDNFQSKSCLNNLIKTDLENLKIK